MGDREIASGAEAAELARAYKTINAVMRRKLSRLSAQKKMRPTFDISYIRMPNAPFSLEKARAIFVPISGSSSRI